MSFLPAFIRLRANGWPTLWLPLFLLWPLVLVLFGSACIAIFVLSLVPTEHTQGPRPTESIRGLWRLLCATRGAHVQVDDAALHLSISIH